MESLKENPTKSLVYAGFFIALGVLLPLPFHITGIAGTIFLPMHIPVLIGGFYLGGLYGLLIGLVTPLLSHMATGMPPLAPVPIAVIMAFELGAYGLLAGFLYQKIGKIWYALIGSMIGGRLVAGLTVWSLIILFGFHQLDYPLAFITGAVATGVPGIALQLLLVPLIVSRLEARSSVEHFQS